MIEVRAYRCSDGSRPFKDWFDRLDTQTANKVTTYIDRISDGNTSNLKSVGSGVYECRIDWGAGYRIYLGIDSKNLMILLGGGTKKRQQDDIDRAKLLWQEYKKRKEHGREK